MEVVNPGDGFAGERDDKITFEHACRGGRARPFH